MRCHLTHAHQHKGLLKRNICSAFQYRRTSWDLIWAFKIQGNNTVRQKSGVTLTCLALTATPHIMPSSILPTGFGECLQQSSLLISVGCTLSRFQLMVVAFSQLNHIWYAVPLQTSSQMYVGRRSVWGMRAGTQWMRSDNCVRLYPLALHNYHCGVCLE